MHMRALLHLQACFESTSCRCRCCCRVFNTAQQSAAACIVWLYTFAHCVVCLPTLGSSSCIDCRAFGMPLWL